MLGATEKVIVPRVVPLVPAPVSSYPSVLKFRPVAVRISPAAPVGIVTRPAVPQNVALFVVDVPHATSVPSPGTPAPPSHQFRFPVFQVPAPPRFAPVETSLLPGTVVDASGSQYRFTADALPTTKPTTSKANRFFFIRRKILKAVKLNI